MKVTQALKIRGEKIMDEAADKMKILDLDKKRDHIVRLPIKNKIALETPDATCWLCDQCYEGECRAFSAPRSGTEYEKRSSGFGMECDSPQVKESRKKKGIQYHI